MSQLRAESLALVPGMLPGPPLRTRLTDRLNRAGEQAVGTDEIVPSVRLRQILDLIGPEWQVRGDHSGGNGTQDHHLHDECGCQDEQPHKVT